MGLLVVGVCLAWSSNTAGWCCIEGFTAAATIPAAVSSICPFASPMRTRCHLAAASVGTGQLRYWRVASCRSSITSSVVRIWMPGRPLGVLLLFPSVTEGRCGTEVYPVTGMVTSVCFALHILESF